MKPRFFTWEMAWLSIVLCSDSLTLLGPLVGAPYSVIQIFFAESPFWAMMLRSDGLVWDSLRPG